MGDKWRAAFYAFARTAVRAALLLVFRVRAYGPGNLPDRGGVLILSNHQSYLDPMLIGSPVRRRLVYMARETLFRNRLFGALLHTVGAFSVRPGRPDKNSIRAAVDKLAGGEALVMFPEGTRSHDGELRPVKSGFCVLVRRARVPVIPVALDGPYKVWPRTRLLPRLGQVRIRFGRVIPYERLAAMPDEEAVALVQREIGTMLSELRRLP